MIILDAAKIKIFSKIIRKLEPSESEYESYEKDIRQSKLDLNMGYNSALGFIVLTRALRITLDHFIVLMIRILVIAAVISIITMSYV